MSLDEFRRAVQSVNCQPEREKYTIEAVSTSTPLPCTAAGNSYLFIKFSPGTSKQYCQYIRTALHCSYYNLRKLYIAIYR